MWSQNLCPGNFHQLKFLRHLQGSLNFCCHPEILSFGTPCWASTRLEPQLEYSKLASKKTKKNWVYKNFSKKRGTPPKFNSEFSPENWWLEASFWGFRPIFRDELLVLGRVKIQKNIKKIVWNHHLSQWILLLLPGTVKAPENRPCAPKRKRRSSSNQPNFRCELICYVSFKEITSLTLKQIHSIKLKKSTIIHNHSTCRLLHLMPNAQKSCSQTAELIFHQTKAPTVHHASEIFSTSASQAIWIRWLIINSSCWQVVAQIPVWEASSQEI